MNVSNKMKLWKISSHLQGPCHWLACFVVSIIIIITIIIIIIIIISIIIIIIIILPHVALAGFAFNFSFTASLVIRDIYNINFELPKR